MKPGPGTYQAAGDVEKFFEPRGRDVTTVLGLQSLAAPDAHGAQVCSGVTGAGGGTFVTTRGDFYRYQRAGPAPRSPRTLTFVRRDSARAAVLVDAAVREGITRVRYVKPYNMTCHLSLAARDTSYEVAWPMDTSPEPIRKLVAIAKELEAAGAP